MVMELDQEHLLRLEVLERARTHAAQEGLPPEKLQQLRERVLGEMAEAFRRSLTGEPSAKVMHKRVESKNEARALKAWPCVYPPGKQRQWLFQ